MADGSHATISGKILPHTELNRVKMSLKEQRPTSWRAFQRFNDFCLLRVRVWRNHSFVEQLGWCVLTLIQAGPPCTWAVCRLLSGKLSRNTLFVYAGTSVPPPPAPALQILVLERPRRIFPLLCCEKLNSETNEPKNPLGWLYMFLCSCRGAPLSTKLMLIISLASASGVPEPAGSGVKHLVKTEECR